MWFAKYIMRIYVDNYSMTTFSQRKKKLEPYKTTTRALTQLYSPSSGIFHIEPTRAYKRTIPEITKPSVRKVYSGFSLILPQYEDIKEEVWSQLPADGVFYGIQVTKYAMNKEDPRVFLIVESVDQNVDPKCVDFYFETNNNCEGINNAQFQEEFSGFLSLLK